MSILMPLHVKIGSVILCCTAVVACDQVMTGSASPLVAGHIDPIVDGDIETGYEAVSAPDNDRWGFDHFCSGTLIAPRWVLTAAHCVVRDGSVISTRNVGFFVGTYSNEADGTIYDVSSFHPHPAYSPGSESLGTPPQHDIALVELSSAASATPIEINRESLADAAGEAITWVGFGVSDPPYDGSGTKRSGAGHLTDVYWWLLVWGFEGQLPCSGDSGGATLMDFAGTERIVGVISTADEGCTEGGTGTRVDGYAAWIDATMAGEDPDWGCDVRGGDCAAGYACLPELDVEDGFCWASDELGEGEACDPSWGSWDRAPCADGLICAQVGFSGQCLHVCFSSADCDGTDECELPLYSDLPWFGVCQPCRDIDHDGFCVDDDCDDTDERAFPGNPEICNDRVDNDCDGARDEEDEDCACEDGDGDGTCAADDCDDDDPARSPAFNEDCDDGIDNDCDEAVDVDDLDCGGDGDADGDSDGDGDGDSDGDGDGDADGDADADGDSDGDSDGEIDRREAGCECSAAVSVTRRVSLVGLIALLDLS